jgi:hypothetical protein
VVLVKMLKMLTLHELFDIRLINGFTVLLCLGGFATVDEAASPRGDS